MCEALHNPFGFRDESPRQVSEFLSNRAIRPSKALGQNFLADGNVLDKIVEEASVTESSRVVEVGPGLGALTARLLRTGASVIAIEKDPQLQPVLHERFADERNFRLVCADALRVDWNSFFPGEDFSLVSNLPYSVGSRVVVDAATGARPPGTMVLLLQKEVGERFSAPPSSPARGAVSVILQRRYDVKIVRDVAPTCFVPRPDVVSAVVSLRRHERYPLSDRCAATFNALVKAAFLHRRKQLCSSLKAAGPLSKPADFIRAALRSCGASDEARAENLSIEQWLEFAKNWF